jgi:ribosomal protein S18 acetylase RimI-like enzyme
MIRHAHGGDLSQLADLLDGYRQFYRQPSDRARSIDFLSKRFDEGDSVIIVAETGETGQEQLSGFTQLYSQFSTVRLGRYWLLNDLYIHPDHRRKGIATLLIDEAKAYAKETHALGLLLETEKINKPGLLLYPKLGFAKYDSTRFFWWSVQQ